MEVDMRETKEDIKKEMKQQFDALIQLLDVPKKEFGVGNGLDKEGSDD